MMAVHTTYQWTYEFISIYEFILWPFIQPKCKSMSIVTKPICSCQDENMNTHVHLNSYVTNNKFPKNKIKKLCLIKFFLQNPTTSMRNWVCPHKSLCRAGCDGH